MLIQTEARIYLENQRGVTQLDKFRSFHSFNSGVYQQEGRQFFGSLTTLDDDTLLAGGSNEIRVEESVEIVLLPVVGGLEFTDGSETLFAASGEVLHFLARPGNVYSIVNPYAEEAVNYLQIRFKRVSANADTAEYRVINFDLSRRNELLPLFSTSNGSQAYIGTYSGRSEEVLTLQNPKNGVFAFIIAGAFEVQNRLLEKRDGLSLRNAEAIDFEALSNEAIILVLEIAG